MLYPVQKLVLQTELRILSSPKIQLLIECTSSVCPLLSVHNKNVVISTSKLNFKHGTNIFCLALWIVKVIWLPLLENNKTGSELSFMFMVQTLNARLLVFWTVLEQEKRKWLLARVCFVLILIIWIWIMGRVCFVYILRAQLDSVH